MSQVKILLDESEIPANWYNVVADMPKPPAPLLSPDGKPVESAVPSGDFSARDHRTGNLTRKMDSDSRTGPRNLSAMAPDAHVSRASIGAGARHPAKIYYKYEGVSPAGSHKPNTSVAQAYYNQREACDD